MTMHFLASAGLALAAFGQLAWQAAAFARGAPLVANALGGVAALGFAIAAWGFADPRERTGAIAAGLALPLGVRAFDLAMGLSGVAYWMLPQALTIVALAMLAWTAFVTARGAWGAGAAREAIPGAALAIVASALWLPINVQPAFVLSTPGTLLSTLGFATLALGLWVGTGGRLPALPRRRARSA